MTTRQPILIAGGGIGGLALAVALARAGRNSIVLEQRHDFVTAGAGIQLGPNGVRVLQRLGVADALRPLVGEPDAIRVHHGRSGRTIASLPLGRWMVERHGAPYWVAHRADLHGALLAAASTASCVELRTGFALAAIRQYDHGVEVSSSDGSLVQGAAVVGADGLWSRVRREVCPSLEPKFVGATATRAVMPASEAGRLAGTAVGLWLTPRAHVVHYPVRGGAEVAVVVIASESWHGQEWDAEADWGILLRQLAGLHASLTDILSRVVHWRKWALYRLPPLPQWSAGRVTLLGDAAHPMLPYLAQGGVLALEDALMLADCLSAHADHEAAAFRQFEGLRRRRATRAQAASRRQGRIYHLDAPTSWARDAVLRLAPGAALMASYDWLYGWREDQPPRKRFVAAITNI